MTPIGIRNPNPRPMGTPCPQCNALRPNGWRRPCRHCLDARPPRHLLEAGHATPWPKPPASPETNSVGNAPTPETGKDTTP